MNVQNVGFVQQYNSHNTNKKIPSFKSELIITKEAELALSPLIKNFDSSFVIYKNAVEKATDGIGGIIKLFLGRNSNKEAEIMYITPEGVEVTSRFGTTSIHPFDMVQNNSKDQGTPMRNALSTTIGNVAGLLEENRYRGDKNPFLKLYTDFYE